MELRGNSESVSMKRLRCNRFCHRLLILLMKPSDDRPTVWLLGTSQTTCSRRSPKQTRIYASLNATSTKTQVTQPTTHHPIPLISPIVANRFTHLPKNQHAPNLRPFHSPIHPLNLSPFRSPIHRPNLRPFHPPIHPPNLRPFHPPIHPPPPISPTHPPTSAHPPHPPPPPPPPHSPHRSPPPPIFDV